MSSDEERTPRTPMSTKFRNVHEILSPTAPMVAGFGAGAGEGSIKNEATNFEGSMGARAREIISPRILPRNARPAQEDISTTTRRIPLDRALSSRAKEIFKTHQHHETDIRPRTAPIASVERDKHESAINQPANNTTLRSTTERVRRAPSDQASAQPRQRHPSSLRNLEAAMRRASNIARRAVTTDQIPLSDNLEIAMRPASKIATGATLTNHSPRIEKRPKTPPEKTILDSSHSKAAKRRPRDIDFSDATTSSDDDAPKNTPGTTTTNEQSLASKEACGSDGKELNSSSAMHAKIPPEDKEERTARIKSDSSVEAKPTSNDALPPALDPIISLQRSEEPGDGSKAENNVPENEPLSFSDLIPLKDQSDVSVPAAVESRKQKNPSKQRPVKKKPPSIRSDSHLSRSQPLHITDVQSCEFSSDNEEIPVRKESDSKTALPRSEPLHLTDIQSCDSSNEKEKESIRRKPRFKKPFSRSDSLQVAEFKMSDSEPPFDSDKEDHPDTIKIKPKRIRMKKTYKQRLAEVAKIQAQAQAARQDLLEIERRTSQALEVEAAAKRRVEANVHLERIHAEKVEAQLMFREDSDAGKEEESPANFDTALGFDEEPETDEVAAQLLLADKVAAAAVVEAALATQRFKEQQQEFERVLKEREEAMQIVPFDPEHNQSISEEHSDKHPEEKDASFLSVGEESNDVDTQHSYCSNERESREVFIAAARRDEVAICEENSIVDSTSEEASISSKDEEVKHLEAESNEALVIRADKSSVDSTSEMSSLVSDDEAKEVEAESNEALVTYEEEASVNTVFETSELNEDTTIPGLDNVSAMEDENTSQHYELAGDHCDINAVGNGLVEFDGRNDEEDVLIDVENPADGNVSDDGFRKESTSRKCTCCHDVLACTWAILLQCYGWLQQRSRRLCWRRRRRRRRRKLDGNHRVLKGPLCIVAWCIGSRISRKEEEEIAEAKKRCRRLRRHLAPPNPCDIPERKLHCFLQARLVLIMWIHAIGCILIGGIGGGAYANNLTWRPELGAAIGPPLSLATLSVCKGATSLLVIASLFQRVRIPPCLAILGCAPIPLKTKNGHRPFPFRKLSSQMLKRLMCAKVLDSAFGFTLTAALKSAMVRSRGRRGHLLKFMLGMIAIGVALVDFYGLPVSLGTIAHYIHYLWYRPDGAYEDDAWDSDSGAENYDSDDDDVVSPLTRLLSSQLDVEQASAPGPTMRFADPDYAREQTETLNSARYAADYQYDTQLISSGEAQSYSKYNPLLTHDTTVVELATYRSEEAHSQLMDQSTYMSSLVQQHQEEASPVSALADYYAEEGRYLEKISEGQRQIQQRPHSPLDATG